MNNRKGFATLVVIAVIIVAAIVSAGTLVVKKSDDNTSQTAVVTNQKRVSPVKANTKSLAIAEFALPSNWKTLKSDGTKPNFAYPVEYGDFVSPAKGMAGKYTLDGLESSSPSKPSVSGLYGKFYFEEYTDSAPIISSDKYGPDVQLKGGTWRVAGVGNSQPGEYAVGDIYKKVSSRNSISGQTVFKFESGDEGVIQYTLAFVTNGHMFTLALPKMELGSYGPNPETTETTKVRQVSYDHFESIILDSVNSK